MLSEKEVQKWVLIVVQELFSAIAMDGLGSTCHCDVYDDQVGDSPGRVASFEIADGKLAWWAWRSEDACARAAWPLKVIAAFGEGEHRTVWVRSNSWALDKADLRRRVVRM